MNYLPWAVLALVAYAFVSPLMSVATTGSPKIPSNVAALMANSLLVVGTAAIVVYNDADALSYLTHPKAKFVFAAGVCLTVGILAYYRALSMGPVSIVSPIFGMFLVLSSVIGIAFLNESLTARKAVGIGLALVAIYLVSVE
ncbi:transporter family protein [Halogeometricum rufum]|jgi:transporter family protein|uniref:Transporter family protein n=1 Tax=Halogeometricum rufum TaxID=553469 RepID=A0A1I6GTR0_9EURY|nr:MULTISPECIES: EamA family transporter [Halogeometricum]MUV57379.1 EamA family transporter [Halogeometricum sp. CBA1124]SFR45447.1 transporter family protein [Halogeometricum rufum]